MSEVGWNDERTDALKGMWRDGLSAAQIARKLGRTTRNAVISKAHRLGLRKGATIMRVARAKLATRTPRAGMAAPMQFSKGNATTSQAPQPLPKPAATDVARKTLVQLEHHDCRWAVGEPGEPGFGFCADKQYPGKPYCLRHFERAYKDV